MVFSLGVLEFVYCFFIGQGQRAAKVAAAATCVVEGTEEVDNLNNELSKLKTKQLYGSVNYVNHCSRIFRT